MDEFTYCEQNAVSSVAHDMCIAWNVSILFYKIKLNNIIKMIWTKKSRHRKPHAVQLPCLFLVVVSSCCFIFFLIQRIEFLWYWWINEHIIQVLNVWEQRNNTFSLNFSRFQWRYQSFFELTNWKREICVLFICLTVETRLFNDDLTACLNELYWKNAI